MREVGVRRFASLLLALALGVTGCSGTEGAGGTAGNGRVGGVGGDGGAAGMGGVGGMAGAGGAIDEWPIGTPESQGFDSGALATLIEEIDGTGVDGLVVVRNGVLILEAYFYPYARDDLHDVASVQKTVTSTLIGIAIDQGLLSVDQAVMPLFESDYPHIPNVDGKFDISVQHLLTMSSGLSSCFGESDGEAILKMRATDNWVRHVLELPMAYAPGAQMGYCTPTIQVLNGVLEKLSDTSALGYAWLQLFGPLDFPVVEWRSDPRGIVGDALLLRPRDMAKLGQLFLNDGTWGGERIISSSWVAEATSPGDFLNYGYLWWLSPDRYEAVGIGGQSILVWPAANLVVAATGGSGGLHWKSGLFEALQSHDALPPNPAAYERLGAVIADAREPPPPQTPYLPPTSEEVSGRLYRLEANRFGLYCFALSFDSDNPSEALIEATMDVGGTIMTAPLPVGLDGILRFTGVTLDGFDIAMEGHWANESFFSLRYFRVGGSAHTRIEADFGSDLSSVQLQIRDETGYTPTESFGGVEVQSCF
jgi:CubicO group peptidase (beta-lactamase class C family)